jgi:hypothetical protein
MYYQKGIARPQSQFPHSCVCERSTVHVPTTGPPIFLQQNRQIVGIYKMFKLFVVVSLQCSSDLICHGSELFIE